MIYLNRLRGRILKTTPLILSMFIAWTGDVYAQITLKSSNQTVQQIMKNIEKQSKYKFFYNSNFNVLSEKKNLSINNASIENTLTKLFANTNVAWEIKDNVIVLTPAINKETVNSDSPKGTTKKIKGVVTDGTGEPVIGANVVVQGTTSGTITDFDGNFTLDVPDNSVLKISYIGMTDMLVQTKGKDYLNVKMDNNSQTLDEVVVVGYGVQKKVNLTGAVSAINMEDALGNRPVNRALEAVEGKVPGLQVNKNSGKPGVSINMNIRGVTSINGGGPLVLVDNVPMSLDMVDPNDIESISVLKDAAASAIYGARAAFGVVLVTTKQGKKDSPTRVTYNNNFAFSKLMTAPEKATPMQTLEYFRDLGVENYWSGQNLNSWFKYMDEYENQGLHQEGFVWGEDGYRYNLARTDSYKDMMDNYGFQQSHNLAVQGGSSKLTYRASFGYVNENGILVSDKDKYERFNVSGFISSEATPWLTAQLDTKYTYIDNSTIQGAVPGSNNIWGAFYDLTSMSPLGYGTQTKDSEEMIPFASPRNAILFHDPRLDENSNFRVLGRMILKPVKNLTITGEYTYNREFLSKRNVYKTYTTMNGEDLGLKTANAVSSMKLEHSLESRNVLNLFANYLLKVKDNSFSFLGGFNQEFLNIKYLSGERKALLDQDLPSIGLATGDMLANDSYSQLALRSLFFRVNYSYKDRYLLEANGRYDGSSRFIKADRFGFFPSFSAAWRISEESYMESVKKTLTNLKLRMSWGNIGNQNTDGYYPYLATLDTNKPKWILPGATDWVTSLSSPGLVSNSFTWEKVSTLNWGIDISLLNKLNATFEYYIRDTKDMLALSAPLPSVLGAPSPKTNVADLRTNGWELSLEWRDKIGENIRYNIGVNLYDSYSTIQRYHNPTGLLTSVSNNKTNLVLREGMRFGEIWGYETDRYLTDADFTNGVVNSGIPLLEGQKVVYPGDIIFKDRNGDGIISKGNNTFDNPGDQKIIGNRTPRYQYGITAGISYKNFDLSMLFNGVGKRDLWLDFFPSNGMYVKNVETFHLNHWTPENPNAFYPRISEKTSTGGNYSVQSKYMSNGSYFRMKNLTLGYNVPKHFCDKVHIQNFRVFVSAENLFTIHHLPKGYLPYSFDTSVGSLALASETSGDSQNRNITYPDMRQFAFGINLTF